jgi:hypothetical protein
MRRTLWVSFWIVFGISCAKQPPATVAAGSEAQGAESKDETFAERERARLKRNQENRAIEERREDFIHRQNNRSGE